MTDKFDAAIQEIAIKHGVVVSKDDPILILQTMNNRLIEETRQAQADMLAHFREEMEGISSQWKDDAKEKAEKVLNAALVGSKEAMTNLLQVATKEYTLAIKKVISDSIAEARNTAKQTKKYSLLTLFGLMLVISCIYLVLFLI
ncbi:MULTISPECIES: conjugal transfer protein TraM [Legionella]|uniref:Conjugal transfer protein TraM n=1 Tax=Legionella sainthelensi TaxID=28087 RepID=A0A2H5FI07_9GAMM|nr:conjugal transfer protein TraM [Legionella sainthelensi]AUH71153.1 conjugal transfer protein TraM [Legionella sainthelensi]